MVRFSICYSSTSTDQFLATVRRTDSLAGSGGSWEVLDMPSVLVKWWFSKGNLLISGKPTLVKYLNLARSVVC